MRLAISNIAWDVNEDEQIGQLLNRYQVDAIDIAPGKYFPDPSQATATAILQVKHYWQDKGIELTGMQSLLFGTEGLNMFGSTRVQQKMLAHLASVCRVADLLGTSRLVFGSPKNRDCTGLSAAKTEQIAIAFFRSLGDIALAQGVYICLEPNPSCYGANFMTTGLETLSIVKAVDHPAIKMQLDTGAITINDEDIHALLDAAYEHIGHIHISEPNLAVIGSANANHCSYSAAIQHYFSAPLISIEMVATKDEAHAASINSALAFVDQTYRQKK